MSDNMIHALLTQPGGYVEEIDLLASNWIQEVSGLMNGAHVARTNIPGTKIAILTDEDGPAKSLSFNSIATEFVARLTGRQVVPLVGTVILTGIIDSATPKSFPEELIDRD